MQESKAIPWSCGGERLWAHPYGDRPADLRVTLTDVPRPQAVTALLSACLRRIDGRALSPDDAWSWNLTGRLQGLLGVAAASLGTDQTVEIRCGGCGVGLDLDANLADFAVIESHESVVCSPADDIQIRLRSPTGEDQRAWLQRWPFGAPTPAELAATLVMQVNGAPPVEDWRPPEDWLDSMEQALEQTDPLTRLTMETRCPECGADLSQELDLEAFVLQRLSARREDLLDEVHSFAMAYHWSEAEIFELPADRRRAYLRRIEREGGS